MDLLSALILRPLSLVRDGVYAALRNVPAPWPAVALVLLAGLLLLPVLLRIGGSRRQAEKGRTHSDRKTFQLLVFACLYLAILVGLLIPSEILNASPGEFVDVQFYRNPDRYLLQTALTGFGMFFLWPLVYGLLLSGRARRILAAVMTVLAGVGMIDYGFFGRGYGVISSLLRYETAIASPLGTVLLNALCLLAAAAGIVVAVRKWPSVVRAVCIYGCIALTAMTAVNFVSMEQKAAELKTISSRETEETPSFRLSRSGKNVVVIMLDRAIGGFVPYILNERPELARQFAGFTWYPNTLSYGFHTNIASPALYGGYDYIPDGLEARKDKMLPEKQNEALKIMPWNFRKAGYEVTVCDAPYANYQWIPDLSIYADDPSIRTFHTIGRFNEYKEEILRWEDQIRNRNLLCYSLMRTAPTLLQPFLYDGGNYLDPDADVLGDHPLWGVSTDFLNSYMVMKNLSAMTEVTEEGTDTFLMLTNEMTHNVLELQEPEYVPARGVDNSAYDAEHPVRTSEDGRVLNLAEGDELLRIHYQSDMAAFLLLGRWMDDLREWGVWDNTRIILVSDHSCYLGLTGIDLSHGRTDLPAVPGSSPEQWTDTTSYNPLLMVKDFGASALRTDDTFMTNADTPLLAMKGLIPDPVNPFTDQPLTDAARMSGEQHLIESSWDIATNNGAFFSDPVRITFRGFDIFDPDAWSLEK